MTASVTAIVVAYGPEPDLADLVEDLAAAVADGEVVVVANPSPQGLWQPPPGMDVQLVANERNVGYGMALNQGSLVARTEVLLLCNSDISVPADLWSRLAVGFELPGVAAASPAMVDPDGTVQELGSFVGADGHTVALGRDPAEMLAGDRFVHTVDYASATCLGVEAGAYASVGGMDPVFGSGYYEDVDLCFRLRALGLHTVVVPTVEVSHRLHGSFGDEAAERMAANRALFVGRHGDQLLGRPPLVDHRTRPHRAWFARDWGRHERLLVVLDDPVAADWELIAELASDPRRLVTLACAERPAELHAWVEYVGEIDTGWLRARRHHPTRILIDDAALARLDAGLTAHHGSTPVRSWR